MSIGGLAVHTQYIEHATKKGFDLTATKIRYTDGTTSMVYGRNLLRDFYVDVRPKGKSSKVKVEWKEISKLRKHRCTQANLLPAIKKALPNDFAVNRAYSTRHAGVSNDLYYTDIHGSSIELAKHRALLNDQSIIPVVGVMDFEWDIGVNTASIGTYVCDDTIYITMRQDGVTRTGLSNEAFIKKLESGYYEDVQTILDTFYEKNPQLYKQTKFKVNASIVDNELDVIRALFAFTHETKPDFLAFWNGISDLTVIKEVCDRWSVELGSFMADPEVPPEFRNTVINEGQYTKLDAKGANKKIPAEAQWHTLTNIASWVYIDIMACYANNRTHLPNLPSYSLDYITSIELGMGKLRLVESPELDGASSAGWHEIMTKDHFLEYSLYALNDVTAPLMLEYLNSEIASRAFPMMGHAPMSSFNSNPTKLTVESQLSFLAKGYAVSATSPSMKDELDGEVYGSDGWIITLNTSYNYDLAGVALEDSSLPVEFIPNGADSDLTASYPSNQMLGNMARHTLKSETVSINGVDVDKAKRAGLTLISGEHNQVGVAIDLLGFPRLEEYLESA